MNSHTFGFRVNGEYQRISIPAYLFHSYAALICKQQGGIAHCNSKEIIKLAHMKIADSLRNDLFCQQEKPNSFSAQMFCHYSIIENLKMRDLTEWRELLRSEKEMERYYGEA